MNYPVITLCGSTKFKDKFMEVQKELTLKGIIVISVGLFGHSGDNEVWEDMSEGTYTKTKLMLDDLHLRKIDMADAIYVINVDGYIGESTTKEIEYAKSHNKKVLYLEPNVDGDSDDISTLISKSDFSSYERCVEYMAPDVVLIFSNKKAEYEAEIEELGLTGDEKKNYMLSKIDEISQKCTGNYWSRYFTKAIDDFVLNMDSRYSFDVTKCNYTALEIVSFVYAYDTAKGSTVFSKINETLRDSSSIDEEAVNRCDNVVNAIIEEYVTNCVLYLIIGPEDYEDYKSNIYQGLDYINNAIFKTDNLIYKVNSKTGNVFLHIFIFPANYSNSGIDGYGSIITSNMVSTHIKRTLSRGGNIVTKITTNKYGEEIELED